jgi:hypothetical protein
MARAVEEEEIVGSQKEFQNQHSSALDRYSCSLDMYAPYLGIFDQMI